MKICANFAGKGKKSSRQEKMEARINGVETNSDSESDDASGGLFSNSREAVEDTESYQLSFLLDQNPAEKKEWLDYNVCGYQDEQYSTDSLRALQLKLVRHPGEVQDDDITFAPDMTYQVFGQSERIGGYKNPKIQLYYSAGNLTTYLGFTYDEKIAAGSNHVLNIVDEMLGEKLKLEKTVPQVDDVMKEMGKFLQEGFHTNINDFTRDLDNEDDFRPHGTLIDKFTESSEDQGEIDYEIYCVSVTTDPKCRSYMERLQMFVFWYIEAANFVDLDDEKWKFFLIFEKYEHDDRYRYAIAGFATVYEFYCYPFNIRPRVSQMLVLPPFQGQGLGAKLLETVFRHYRELPQVTDIAVESPSEDFQRLRDFVDSQAASRLPSFDVANLKKGFSKDMVSEAKIRLKMGKRQALRAYNILRLKACNENNVHEMRKYMDILKSQVDKPHQAMMARAKRKHLFETLSFEQVMNAMPSVNEDYRQAVLKKSTEQMLEHFRQVVNRLNLN